jgi:monodechloroaminopyrrolnitrin synthase
MNEAGDVPAIISALRNLLPCLEVLDAYGIGECIAVMRDLGIFVGSIKRHGVEPLSVVAEATPILKVLGARTDMIPRDTVHHYCTWNPTGDRARMYTGDEQETYLQDSVRLVFPHLRSGLELCDLLGDFHPTDPRFAVLVDALNYELRPMGESINLVVDKVSSKFFARVLRPYFEEIDVDGQTYLGPAAAQVPLWLIDEAVWASDRSEPGYENFLRHSVSYSLPRWRHLHEGWVHQPSMVTRLIEAYGDDPNSAEWFAPSLRASAVALARMLRTVIVFRGRHLGIARRAYQEDLRLYPLGSGGASVDLLRDIIDLTRENAQFTKSFSGRPVAPREAEVA